MAPAMSVDQSATVEEKSDDVVLVMESGCLQNIAVSSTTDVRVSFMFQDVA